MFFQGTIWRKASQQIIKVLNTLPEIKDSRIVLAFSGGQDSVFLLAALAQMKKKYRFEILPLHIEHNFLPEDKSYSRLARKFSKALGFECSFARSRPAPPKVNLENWMRDERYKALEKFRRQKHADYVAVAHHASDQAETVLAHIIRGAGLKGLQGMQPVRGKIIRPMLNCSKKDIKSLMRSSKLPYYEDKLNYSKKYQRNNIRHELIPYLEKEFNPKIVERLVKLAENARQASGFRLQASDSKYRLSDVRFKRSKATKK